MEKSIMVKNSVAIIIFAKVPNLNIAKTRIAKVHGKKIANDIYNELLDITAKIITDFDHHISFSGSDSPKELANIFQNATSFFKQCNGDLGEKIIYSFKKLFQAGYKSIIAIGTDSPELSQKNIIDAIEFLKSEESAVVIGPAVDGGYYLVGCQKRSMDIFSVNSWSKPTLFLDTKKIIIDKSYKYLELEKKNDIDTMEDYLEYKTTRI